MQKFRINEKAAKVIRAKARELTEEKLERILHLVKVSVQRKAVTVKMQEAEVDEKYFSGITAQKRMELIMQALEAGFARKEVAMFSSEDLKCLDLGCFSIIIKDAYDVMSIPASVTPVSGVLETAIPANRKP